MGGWGGVAMQDKGGAQGVAHLQVAPTSACLHPPSPHPTPTQDPTTIDTDAYVYLPLMPLCLCVPPLEHASPPTPSPHPQITHPHTPPLPCRAHSWNRSAWMGVSISELCCSARTAHVSGRMPRLGLPDAMACSLYRLHKAQTARDDNAADAAGAGLSGLRGGLGTAGETAGARGRAGRGRGAQRSLTTHADGAAGAAGGGGLPGCVQRWTSACQSRSEGTLLPHRAQCTLQNDSHRSGACCICGPLQTCRKRDT